MSDWSVCVQAMVERIDASIRREEDASLTLAALSEMLGYSAYYTSRKFRQISGMSLKDYLRFRRLAFALRDLRETEQSVLEIALRYGFSSGEAFSRAFRAAYGVSPRQYRQSPVPLALRTILRPWDCYLAEAAGKAPAGDAPAGDAPVRKVKTYFVQIPAHRFLHIRNDESIGYWDFWQKQSRIPGQDRETICGLLSQIPGKLDDAGGSGQDAGSGQLMAWINAPEGRICSWGIPLAEAYGVRLPADFGGAVPPSMRLMDVPEGEYLVFEHGPFDAASESQSVEVAVETAMREFDYAGSGYELDFTPERVFYFYHDCTRFFKYVRPVRRKEGGAD